MVFGIFSVLMRDVLSSPIDTDFRNVERVERDMNGEYENGEYFETDMNLNVCNEHEYRWKNATVPFALSDVCSTKGGKRKIFTVLKKKKA